MRCTAFVRGRVGARDLDAYLASSVSLAAVGGQGLAWSARQSARAVQRWACGLGSACRPLAAACRCSEARAGVPRSAGEAVARGAGWLGLSVSQCHENLMGHVMEGLHDVILGKRCMLGLIGGDGTPEQVCQLRGISRWTRP